MDIKIEPAVLDGMVQSISSKSAAHRSLICAALCQEPTELLLTDRSADIDATLRCLRAMGTVVEIEEGRCRIVPAGAGRRPEEILLDCGESGSTLRFLLPVAAALGKRVRAQGTGRLPQRPMAELLQVLSKKGCSVLGCSERKQGDSLPVILSGCPESGEFFIRGDISSQYISGLLFLFPLLEGPCRLKLTSPMESAGYVDMTIDTMRQFGVAVEREYEGERLTGFLVEGGQGYRSPGTLLVESDWSNAAFFLAAGALGQGLGCRGLDLQSVQGDKAVLEVLKSMGTAVCTDSSGTLWAEPGKEGLRSGIRVDVSQIPDLVPVLAIAACGALGKTVFYNGARLRLKESDRIASTAALIKDLGGSAAEGPDSLTVWGVGSLRGGIADGCGDHRIVMSAAVASVLCKEPIIIRGAEAVEKSYPRFFEHFNQLGGNAHVI